jgi:hypothetical protein
VYEFKDAIIKGNVIFSSERDSQHSRSSQSSPTPARPKAQAKKRRDRMALLVEESDTSDSAPSSSRGASPAPSQSHRYDQPATPVSVAAWREGDEGYGTAVSSGLHSEVGKRAKLDDVESEYTHARSHLSFGGSTGKRSLTGRKAGPSTPRYAGTLRRTPSSNSLEESRHQRKHRITNPPVSESDGENGVNDRQASGSDEGVEDNEDEDEDEDTDEQDNDGSDDSDDDFAKRTIKLEGPNRDEIEVRAILDTGTKPNWVSSRFLEKLKKKQTKLREDQNKEYRDFNGKRFKACGKVELSIMCDDFQGFKCKNLPFLVARESAFDILLGRNTIRDEYLLQTRPSDTTGEGVYPGVQTSQSKGKLSLFPIQAVANTKFKAERTKVAKNKIKQEKEAAELKRKRDERRAKEKQAERHPMKPLPAANFAPDAKSSHRKERSKSPARIRSTRDSNLPSKALSKSKREKLSSTIAQNSKQALKEKRTTQFSSKEKSSSSSLEGAW